MRSSSSTIPRKSSLADSLSALPDAERASVLADLSPEQARALLYDWEFWARPEQLPPAGDWDVWLFLAGRGAGKTRSGGQETIRRIREGIWRRVALVAPTAADARDVMVEGESGLLATSPPWFRPEYEPSKRRLTWPNGAMATLYSAEKYQRLNGPQHDGAWADEVGVWRFGEQAWDMLQLGLRLGPAPQTIVTTTPKASKVVRDLVKDERTAVTRASTYANLENLAPAFIARLLRKYEGTRLGRQELHAEILEDAEGALWRRAWLDRDRVTDMPDLVRIVVAVDPAASEAEDSADTGIIVAGLGSNDHGYVLDDRSVHASPATWARAAVAAYHTHRADRIVGEVNNGGDMVEHTVRTVEATVPFTKVWASRGKQIRAEPVAALYEQGRVHHVGNFAQLEDELCTWEPGEKSPDRLDALVWALTELMVQPEPEEAVVEYEEREQISPL